jgi:hypothetical protein
VAVHFFDLADSVGGTPAGFDMSVLPETIVVPYGTQTQQPFSALSAAVAKPGAETHLAILHHTNHRAKKPGPSVCLCVFDFSNEIIR